MDDLTIVKYCAEAMNIPLRKDMPNQPTDRYSGYPYRPLHDDAQCFALVKKMKLEPRWNDERQQWLVAKSYTVDPSVWNADLNRAICECVARMQQAKR